MSAIKCLCGGFKKVLALKMFCQTCTLQSNQIAKFATPVCLYSLAFGF